MAEKNETPGQAQPASNRRDLIAVAVFLALVLLAGAGLAAMPTANTANAPKQDSGAVIDLRFGDFAENIYVIDKGIGWESWRSELYTPLDFENGVTGEPHVLLNSDYRQTQFFTHRLTLLLIPGESYGISVRSADYSMRMF